MPKKNFDAIVDTNPALAFMSNKEGKAPTIHDSMIKIDLLIPYENHPFKLYEGERLDDMVRSIKEMGILLPIIVRPVDPDDKLFEILSGHNRFNAAKIIGLTEVPVIIKRDLSDDDAALIVTETNLVQRSFADLSHSERAIAIKTHMDAISKQGKRSDIISEINILLNADKTDENETCGTVCHNTKSRDKTAEKYGLSSRSISNYIRLCKLDKLLLSKVDSEEIAFFSAVAISYLLPDEQTELNRILNETKYKVDMKKAELLRESSESKKLTADRIEQILSGEFNKNSKSKSPKAYKIKPKIYSKFFDDTMKHTEVDVIIEKALEEYFIQHK